MNLGVLASHEGTTLQCLLDAFAGGRIPGRVSVVVSNNGDSGALVKAREAGVQAVHLSSRTHRDPATLDAAIRDVLANLALEPRAFNDRALIEPSIYCGSAQTLAPR
jgi:folate-dependent phosphoribosylglycinamide formyltransferase PurN